MSRTVNILILGGTTEAAQLAVAAAADPRYCVTTSLAGRTRAPAPLPGLRIGGFGGVGGLLRFLHESATKCVIDATHPFAAQISAQASKACTAANLPRLVLQRPPWTAVAGDRWASAATIAGAAKLLRPEWRRVFLSTGRKELGPFAGKPNVWFLVRIVDGFVSDLGLANSGVIVGRGPFELAQERTLLSNLRIASLIVKNSGGAGTYAKLTAARELGLPVVMVERPPAVLGERVESTGEALRWLDRIHKSLAGLRTPASVRPK